MTVDTKFEDGTVPEVEPDLAAEAASGLDVFAPQAEEQLPIVPVVQVKFAGLKYDSVEDLPPLKAHMKFEIEGFVIGHAQRVKANGEIQDQAIVQITKVNAAAVE